MPEDELTADRYGKGATDKHYVLYDLTSLPGVSDVMIAAGARPSGPVMFGIPFSVIMPLGRAAPIALIGL